MCRIAAFPPGFQREVALNILANFERGNLDGVGYVYVEDKQFKVQKWPTSFSVISKDNPEFLGHMPYKGWTLAHLRAGTHGGKTLNNTHPFIVGNWAIVHNGVWNDFHLIKALLAKASVKFDGETDSEVAAHVFNILGPQMFTKHMTGNGVFIGLNLDGNLHVALASGMLYAVKLTGKRCVLASDFDSNIYKKTYMIDDGYYFLRRNGRPSNKTIYSYKFGSSWSQRSTPVWQPNHTTVGRWGSFMHYDTVDIDR